MGSPIAGVGGNVLLGSGWSSLVMKSAARFDAPFWAVLLAGTILVGALSCIGIAAFAQDASYTDMEVLTTDDLPPGGPAALLNASN